MTHHVRQHMFRYEPGWTDSAVRRFIGKVGRDEVDDLFALREADNIGSGRPPLAGDLDELRERVERELEAGVVLDLRGLAIGGDDLMTELGLRPGPELGRILDALLERVIADPSINQRPTLLAEARALHLAGAS